MVKKLTCKRCGKKVQHLATTGRNPKELYTICWDCLIELDINHKNFKKYKKNT
jgi:transcription elongation factor Elf1